MATYVHSSVSVRAVSSETVRNLTYRSEQYARMAHSQWNLGFRDADSRGLALLYGLRNLRLRCDGALCILLLFGHIARPGLKHGARFREAQTPHRILRH